MLNKKISFLPNGKLSRLILSFMLSGGDEMIQTVAEESGHKIMLKRRIKDFRDGKLILDEEEIEAEVLRRFRRAEFQDCKSNGNAET